MRLTVKALRTATGRTRAEVAADLGISARHLYRLEAAAELPRRWCLVFGAYYDVDPRDIAGCGEAVSA